MPKQRNEGEGNRTAAKRYNESQRKFVRAGRVKPAAEEARRALEETHEGVTLREAEAKGRPRQGSVARRRRGA
jgi:hypothetical protein